MGCSFSSNNTAAVNDGNLLVPPTALVVATDGSLLECNGGIRASKVMIATGQVYALCNSDELFFDAYPRAMAHDKVLVPGQIYFLLPLPDLNRRLSGANAAALAVRASAAMRRAEKQGRRIRVDVDVGDGDEKLDFRLAPARKEMMTKKKGVGRGLSTIEEVDEDLSIMLTSTLC